MHHASIWRDIHILECTIALPIRVNVPIAFESCEPVPIVAPNRFEVLQTAIPPIERHYLRLEAALLGSGQHGPTVGILAHAIHRLVVQALVTWDRVCTITP